MHFPVLSSWRLLLQEERCQDVWRLPLHAFFQMSSNETNFFFFAAYLFLSRLTETITSRQRERNLKGPDSWKKIIIKIKKGLDLNHKQSIFYVTVHHCIRKDAHLTTDLSFRTFHINRFYSPQRRKEQILLFSLSLEAFSFSFIRILRL